MRVELWTPLDIPWQVGKCSITLFHNQTCFQDGPHRDVSVSVSVSVSESESLSESASASASASASVSVCVCVCVRVFRV